jgi:hypothetical protein
VHPKDYKDRFIEFMKNSVIINQKQTFGSNDDVKPNSLVESVLSQDYKIVGGRNSAIGADS